MRMKVLDAGLWWLMLLLAAAGLIAGAVGWGLGVGDRPDIAAAASTGIPGQATGPPLRAAIRELSTHGGSPEDDAIEY